jgi:hypothetical protein
LIGSDKLQMRGVARHVPRPREGRRAGRTVAARLTLHDEGNGDRMVTSASAAFDII